MLGCWRTNKRIRGGRMRWRRSDLCPSQSCVRQMDNRTGHTLVVNMCWASGVIADCDGLFQGFPSLSLPWWQVRDRRREGIWGRNVRRVAVGQSLRISLTWYKSTVSGDMCNKWSNSRSPYYPPCKGSHLFSLLDTALSVSIVLDYISPCLLHVPSLMLYLLPGSAITPLFSGCTMLSELELQLIMPPAQTALISLCINKQSLNRFSWGEYVHCLLDGVINSIHFSILCLRLSCLCACLYWQRCFCFCFFTGARMWILIAMRPTNEFVTCLSNYLGVSRLDWEPPQAKQHTCICTHLQQQ